MIAGWGEADYEHMLRRKVLDENLGSRVHFVGPQQGADKWRSYAAAHAVVLPSFSEGVPMVILEAWAMERAVAMSRHCNLSDAFTVNAALELHPEDISQLAGELTALVNCGTERLSSLAAAGRALIRERYEWTRCARELAAVYKWLIGVGGRPETVFE